MIKSAELITPDEAHKIILGYGVSIQKRSLMLWLERYKGLGRKIAGRHYFDKKRLLILLEGKTWREIQEEEGS